MTARRGFLVAVVLVLAVIGGGIVGLAALGGGAPAPTSVAGTSASPAASGGAASGSPAATSAATTTPAPTPSASATPSPTPSATPATTTAPGTQATIILTALRLDAADDPAGQDRVVSFTTGGSGSISVALTAQSAQGSTRMCLVADGAQLGCRTAADGRLTAKTTKPAASFELTLRGDSAATPTVELTLEFPAKEAAVTVANARFDGTMTPEFNGIQAIVRPRADGDVRVTADWGGHPFLYEIDALEQGGSGSQVLANQGPATRTDATLPVTAANPWKVVLQNIETGFGPTPMTVTIAWP